MYFLPALLVAATFSSNFHPLHVAYTNIDIDKGQETISVSHKIFTQDFTILFAHLFEKNIYPEADSEFTQPEIDLITHYMNHRFNIISQSDTINLNYTGRQVEGESLFLFFKGRFNIKNQSDLIISNLLLLDLYMDQTNLVIVNHGSHEEGLTFNWDKRQDKIYIE